MLLKDLASKYGSVQIITHTDLDGYGAGAILLKTLIRLGFGIDDILITHTDYTNPFPVDEQYNLILLSDISISNSTDARKLLNFASKPNNLLFWFDHHKSSIDMYESHLYPELKNIPGIRDTNASGAMLCWIFYQVINHLMSDKTSRVDDIHKILNNLDIMEIMNSKNPGVWNNCANHTPIGIILTDDYDRFILKDSRSKYYMEAFNSYPDFKRDCKSYYFKYQYVTNNDSQIADFINVGKTLFIWKRIIALNSLKESGFIASFPIEGMKDIEMVCLNSTNKGSMLFGRCLGLNDGPYMQYNYACAYSSRGEKTTVSIYCANPDTTPKENRKNGKIYDASDICKVFGGGGHPGAAGFVTDKVTFCNIKRLPKKLINQIDNEINELIDEVCNDENLY